jgi:hypothetical protein
LVDHAVPPKEDDGENFDIQWHHVDRLPQVHKYQVPLLAEIVLFLKGR